ncbi:hypothetical protein PIB30_031734 [Stylosanthes scabra]|uniref:AAA+ ATPase domain-containing protein n=1 Tax=Stylosanthes scabra TaxID=79078 RepID=A0ABU6TBP5_9FABA|nr:hypothetical protein [Stylosanthes scabra]
MQDICELLGSGLGCSNNNEVRMVGIYGMGGVGKSTLAKAVFNYIADHFDNRCFLENVSEISSKHGLERQQEKLLYDIVGELDAKLGGTSEGMALIKRRLQQKKVLLILDDIDHKKQLQALAGGLDWFGSGSRVIITTRDKKLLKSHGIERTYELKVLNWEDASKMFEWQALKNRKVDLYLINCAVTYCANLPLALEVISSDLASSEVEDWESALSHYQRSLDKGIFDELKRSFDPLENYVQNVFLDIACCFQVLSLTEIIGMLRAQLGFCPKYAIQMLEEKSLITIEENQVRLHNIIHEMGRKIEQGGLHGYRYCLRSYEDIEKMFKAKEIHDKIEMIILDLIHQNVKEFEWNEAALRDMGNLKTLYLPCGFCPKNLTMLKLPNSCLPPLMIVHTEFKNMRVLNFDYAESVRAIPDLSSISGLEELSFAKCRNLVALHNSVGKLSNLKMLDASGCSNLRSFPPLRLPSLEKLNLSSCSSLEKFPEILGNMRRLAEINLSSTAVKVIPTALFYDAPNLQQLSFANCKNLKELDSSVGRLNPKILDASCCSKLRSFPSLRLPSLEKLSQLDLSSTDIIAIPDLSSAPNLQELSFSNCESLFAIDKSVGLLGKLRLLNASGCCKLESFPPLSLPSLEELDLSWCSSLQKFPETLDKMEKITSLTLQYSSIKELPNSIQNLTRLQTLEMLECGMLHLPTNITLLPELRHISFYRAPNEHEGEEKLCWMKSSNSTIYASQCTITDGIFSQVFPWFAMYLEELDLFRVNFTFLPYCTTECELLKELNLDQCHNLQKIRWLPPNLEKLSVTCCTSFQDLDLTILPRSTKEYYNFRRVIVDNCENLRIINGIPPEGLSASNCPNLPAPYISNLLNQDLREDGGNMWRFVTGNRIQGCFHACGNGNSFPFWFQNQFPAISLCVFLGTLGNKRQMPFYFCIELEINHKIVKKWFLEDNKKHYWVVKKPSEADHIFVLHEKHLKYENSVNEALHTGWNYAEVFVHMYSLMGMPKIDVKIGIRTLKEDSRRISLGNAFHRST